MNIRNIKSHQAFRLHFIILALSVTLITSCIDNPVEEILEKARDAGYTLEQIAQLALF